jgi:hypothetical protein
MARESVERTSLEKARRREVVITPTEIGTNSMISGLLHSKIGC